MRLSPLYAALAAAVLLWSCSSEEGRVIPRDKLSRIYAEMFVADQRIGQDRKARSMADTSYVYEPMTSIILEEEIADLKRRKAALAPIEEALILLEKYRPEKVFYMTGVGSPSVFREDSLGFYVDSAGGPQYFDARTWLDTAFFGPVMTVAADSIAVPADSVAAVDGKEDIREMR